MFYKLHYRCVRNGIKMDKLDRTYSMSTKLWLGNLEDTTWGPATRLMASACDTGVAFKLKHQYLC